MHNSPDSSPHSDALPFERQMQTIDALVEQIEQSPDTPIRDAARELVRLILEIHRSGLTTMLNLLSQSGDGGAVVDALQRDNTIRGLLLLHDLHPKNLETRVRGAIESVQDHASALGARIELIEIADGVVRVRIDRDGPDRATPVGVRRTLESAIADAAPDLVAIDILGESPPSGGFVQLGIQLSGSNV